MPIIEKTLDDDTEWELSATIDAREFIKFNKTIAESNINFNSVRIIITGDSYALYASEFANVVIMRTKQDADADFGGKLIAEYDPEDFAERLPHNSRNSNNRELNITINSSKDNDTITVAKCVDGAEDEQKLVATQIESVDDIEEYDSIPDIEHQTTFKTRATYFDALLPIYEDESANGHANVDLETDGSQLEAAINDEHIGPDYAHIQKKSWVQDVVQCENHGGPSRFSAHYLGYVADLLPTNDLLKFRLGEEKPLVIEEGDFTVYIAPRVTTEVENLSTSIVSKDEE